MKSTKPASGDILSFVTAGTPRTGHVATIACLEGGEGGKWLETGGESSGSPLSLSLSLSLSLFLFLFLSRSLPPSSSLPPSAFVLIVIVTCSSSLSRLGGEW